jgi:hypothetical protein
MRLHCPSAPILPATPAATMRLWCLVGLTALTTACAGVNVDPPADATFSGDSAGVPDSSTSDGGFSFDSGGGGNDAIPFADAPTPTDTASDATSGSEEIPCEFPGEWGCTCETNEDCNAGYCIDGGDEKLCTKTCLEDCPTGWKCAQEATGGDVVFLCIPTFAKICRPCDTNQDCLVGGDGGGAVCVTETDEGGALAGGFCGTACAADNECPDGYSCVDHDGDGGDGVPTENGGAGGTAQQCLPDDNQCTCGPAAISAGASTSCEVTNEFGTCNGARTCQTDGSVSPCSAVAPAPEACNNVDDNCNGTVDEGCDDDGDGYCDATLPIEGTPDICPNGGGDGNDTNNEINPGADETCDGIDNDTDGQTDEGHVDSDDDGTADCVDEDDDGDGEPDATDNCPLAANASQTNADGDAQGDLCDDDDDNDGIPDEADNCPVVNNPSQFDIDLDGKGDACDEDEDGDGFPDDSDNCPLKPGPQTDTDGDGQGDICDIDDDDDGILDQNDNCPLLAGNTLDNDQDGKGDICDDDDDNDGTPDLVDNCPMDAGPQTDTDNDGQGDLCDSDDDDDGTPDAADSCPLVVGPQKDSDDDGLGDICDPDDDNDGIPDVADSCPLTAGPPTDTDGDGKGDVCDDDDDNDGEPDVTDCAPLDAAIYPGAAEVCDDIDNNCQLGVDEVCDKDSDGYCDEGAVIVGNPKVCSAGLGDCNDNAPAVNPGATEVCNDVDDDCKGGTDPGCDDDKDGFCDINLVVIGNPNVCPLGAGDCNDQAKQVNPNALEVCGDNLDNNCNSAIDENNASGCATYYVDGDKDGYGDPQVSACICPANAGPGWASNNKDCNDGDKAIKPGAIEACGDGLDNNCNGQADEEGASGCTTYYLDGDNDTWGALNVPGQCTCGPKGSYTATKTGDCDDNAANRFPNNPETCNGIDDDCAGGVDDGSAVANCPNPASGIKGCSGGQCVITSCPGTTFDVDGNYNNGCECQADGDYATTGGTCQAAKNLGNMNEDGLKAVQGNIMPGEDGDWYRVKAIDNTDVNGGCDKFHLRARLTGNPSGQFVVDLYKGGCAGGNQLCAGETDTGWGVNFYGTPFGPQALSGEAGGTGKDYPKGGTVYKSPNPLPAGECKCSYNNGSEGPGMPGMNLCTSNTSWFYVRVRRKANMPPTCDNYVLEISNGKFVTAP